MRQGAIAKWFRRESVARAPRNLEGQQPKDPNLAALLGGIPLAREEQRRAFGFSNGA